RERNLAMFASGGARVLVATDIAARGVHVDEVELVVHIDPPSEHKSYLHRSGRTARAGSSGDVVTVVLPEQRQDTQVLMRKAGIKVTPQQVNAASDAGAVAVTPAQRALHNPGGSSIAAARAAHKELPVGRRRVITPAPLTTRSPGLRRRRQCR